MVIRESILMATEKIKFKIQLYATMWNRPPIAEVLINDHQYFHGQIFGTKDDPNIIEFEHEFEEGKDNSLVIKRTGKIPKETVAGVDGKVIKDQLLHIKTIDMDKIDIGVLVYHGVFTPSYPEPWATQQRAAGVDLPVSLDKCVDMGHNGVWRFTFQSPFYMWFLDNLY